jgi:putative SOS response-associated peptidase YedK
MVTVNCADHPFYSQFHEPGKEKRMPVFLEPEEYDGWMSCPLSEAPNYFRQWQGPFKGFPVPKAPRVPKGAAPTANQKLSKPPRPTEPPSAQGDLF